jgi:hypothetical protein
VRVVIILVVQLGVEVSTVAVDEISITTIIITVTIIKLVILRIQEFVRHHLHPQQSLLSSFLESVLLVVKSVIELWIVPFVLG